MAIIGREKEKEEFRRLYDSGKAEFVAIYGRRRVGKTFLVDETLKGKITFRHAGLSPVEKESKKNSLKEQLKHFYYSLQAYGLKKKKCPASWMEAFFMLSQLLESKDDGKTRQVVFLDELPWMDTPRSGFITAFEGFWNTWACHRDNLMLVVCGSANSWMLDNLVNNHGGLYGRTTYGIKLSPFNLHECEEYFKQNGFKISRYDIVQSYMVFGGIPFYLGYMDKNLSLAQNIDNIFFKRGARLASEYDRLFSSVFANPDEIKRIVIVLSKRHSGFTRREILQQLKIEDSGNFSKMLDALVASDFVERYVPFGESKRNTYFRLVDPFCLFFLRFVGGKNEIDENFWRYNVTSPSVNSWRGFAFEGVCFRHIPQIKQALGISGVVTSQSSWSLKGDDNIDGTQIDMLIDRNDNVVNMCEMKFYNEEFTVNKQYHSVLVHRQNVLSGMIARRKTIHSTLITTYGLTHNEYSGDFQQVITIDALFR